MKTKVEGWGLWQRRIRIREWLGTRRLHFHKADFSFLIKQGLHIEVSPGITGLHDTRGYLVHPRKIIVYPVPKNLHTKRFCMC